MDRATTEVRPVNGADESESDDSAESESEIENTVASPAAPLDQIKVDDSEEEDSGSDDSEEETDESGSEYESSEEEEDGSLA